MGVLDHIKTQLFQANCPHAPAVGTGSAIIKQTKWDDEKGVVNRRALCAMCGTTWENIPDWATFKPSPGRPKTASQLAVEKLRKENGK